MPVAAEPRVLFTGEFEALIVALSSGDLQPVAKAVDQPRLICSVREADAAAELGRYLKGASPVVVDPPHGLSFEVDAPESVGSDRLFAARGALDHRPQNWIVVQVGTALTVDAVRWTGEQGAFLGGAIAPGPRLLSEALHAGGARLPLVDPQPMFLPLVATRNAPWLRESPLVLGVRLKRSCAKLPGKLGGPLPR